jgi:hypothetical protein
VQRADLGLPASRYLFFGGFLFSRFGAFLFPMHTVSHIRANFDYRDGFSSSTHEAVHSV